MKKLLIVSLLLLTQLSFAQAVKLPSYEVNSDTITAIATSQYHNYVVTASREIAISDISTGDGIVLQYDLKDAVWALEFGVDNFAFNEFNDIIVYNFASLSDGYKRLTGHTAKVTALAFSPDGTKLISGSDDATIKLWDINSGKCIKTFTGHKKQYLYTNTYGVTDVVFFSDGKYIASCGADGFIKVWDVNTGNLVKDYFKKDASFFNIDVRFDGLYIISTEVDGTVDVWDIKSGLIVGNVNGAPIVSASFTADGENILLTSQNGCFLLHKNDTVFSAKPKRGSVPFAHGNFTKDFFVTNFSSKSIDVFDVSSCFTITNKVKNYVQKNIKIWQVKGEFEKTADFQKRVNESSRKRKVEELTKLCVDSLKAINAKQLEINPFLINTYDPDNETYLIEHDKLGKFPLPVPVADAPMVKANWSSTKIINPDFYIEDDQFKLAKFSVLCKGKTYTYDSKIPSTYAASNITYNFEPIEVVVPQDKVVKAPTTITTGQSVSVGSVDVDVNIPTTSTINDKTFVVIIANENYQRESKVDFALNDGKMFKAYCEKTLGVPKTNIHFIENATYGNLLAEKDWLSNVLEAGNGSVKGIFYYAGHGIPNEQTKSAYLLPVDGNSTSTATALSLDDLYNSLGEHPSKGVTVFLDACFSGSTRDNGTLASARSGKLKPRESRLTGNLVVFSAATGDETAWPYRDKQHGLFTYYLLKKMQETKGDVTYKDLIGYLTEKVKFESVTKNSKSQTPTVNYSPTVNPVWENWKLK